MILCSFFSLNHPTVFTPHNLREVWTKTARWWYSVCFWQVILLPHLFVSNLNPTLTPPKQENREVTSFFAISIPLSAISSPVFTAEWKAYVVKELDALVSSCIVVPCKFTHPEGNLPTSRIRGIWHLSDKRDQRIYYEDATQVLENFMGRTKLLGHLGQSNCSLEIVKIKDHDNGPFCFRIELTKKPEADAADNKFSFEEDCISFKMLRT